MDNIQSQRIKSERERKRRQNRPTQRSRKRKHGRTDGGISRYKKKLRHSRKVPNGLSAKSPFHIKNLRFVTPKPYYDVRPKLYNSKISEESLYKYITTEIELKYKKRLHTNPLLGIPIDLVGAKREEEKKEIPLNSDDMILLGENKRSREKLKYDHTQKPWLRKTEYITSHKQTDGSLDSKPYGMKKKVKFDVEASFNDSKNFDIKKPGVEVVGEYELFPNFVLWENKYFEMQFDSMGEYDQNEEQEHDGLLKQDRHNERNMLYYETQTNGDNRYTFKRKYTTKTYQDDSLILKLGTNRLAEYNYIEQCTNLKLNPYKGNRKPNGLKIEFREKNNEEIEHMKKKMEEVGVEMKKQEEDDDLIM